MFTYLLYISINILYNNYIDINNIESYTIYCI